MHTHAHTLTHTYICVLIDEKYVRKNACTRCGAFVDSATKMKARVREALVCYPSEQAKNIGPTICARVRCMVLTSSWHALRSSHEHAKACSQASDYFFYGTKTNI